MVQHISDSDIEGVLRLTSGVPRTSRDIDAWLISNGRTRAKTRTGVRMMTARTMKFLDHHGLVKKLVRPSEGNHLYSFAYITTSAGMLWLEAYNKKGRA